MSETIETGLWPRHYYFYHVGRIYTPDEAAAIVRHAQSIGENVSVLHGPDGGQVRNSNLHWMAPAPDRQWIFDRLAQVVHGWNTTFGFELQSQPDALQLTHYVPGQKYDWHMDLGQDRASLRKVSIVVALNSEFEGGGIEFFYGENNPRPALSPGEGVVFPSYIMHRALPVTAGERWSLVAWFDGRKPFR